MIESTSIKEIKGIGEKTERLFAKLGIYTVSDLIRYYPRGYDIYESPMPISEIEEGKTVTVTGAVFGRVQVSGNRNMQVTTMHIKDITGTLKVIWFRMPFLRQTLAKAGVITLRGRIVNRKGGPVMEHPEIFNPAVKYEEKLNTMQPVYTLTTGLSNNSIMKAVRQALLNLDLSKETLPEELRVQYHLAEYNYAIRGIHFPEDKEVFYHARERLVFEEFLRFILSLRALKEGNERALNAYVIKDHQSSEAFMQKLPFKLTRAHISLHQTRHNRVTFHIPLNLFPDFSLCKEMWARVRRL